MQSIDKQLEKSIIANAFFDPCRNFIWLKSIFTMKILLSFLLLLTYGNVYSQNLEESKRTSIEYVISLFTTPDINEISEIIRFPLKREYPIPPIRNKQEFKQRFNQVFDTTLIQKIANSKVEQWEEVGWRGIMFENGILWMENADGIITAINYQSDAEKRLKNDILNQDEESIHRSIKNYKRPVYKIQTKNYHIRIDELPNNEIRYASWKIGNRESSAPDIILYKGKLVFNGSGGNHVITFINHHYTYKIFRNIMAESDSPDITLIVEKDNEVILSQDGKLVID